MGNDQWFAGVGGGDYQEGEDDVEFFRFHSMDSLAFSLSIKFSSAFVFDRFSGLPRC